MTWTLTPITLDDKGREKAGQALALDPAGFEKRSGGVGGWESLSRPRRDPAAAWVGGTDETLTLPVIVSGVDALGINVDRPIDDVCARIEAWGVAGPSGVPPLLRVAGATGVAATSRWVLQDIDWGDYMTAESGARIQQEITLSLLRYRRPALVAGPAKRVKDKRKGKGKGKGKGK